MENCENIYCESLDERMTDHHLYPKAYRHSYIRPKGAIKGRKEKMKLCRACHTVLHRAKTNLELATHYNTKEKVIEFFVQLKNEEMLVA